MPVDESEQFFMKTYDSDSAVLDIQEERTAKEYRGKLEDLNVAKTLEDSAEDEIEKDPLFMNIDKIALLPMASKKPTKILAAEAVTHASSSHTIPQVNQLHLQGKLLENVEERKTTLKKKIQALLEESVKHAPITPRTTGSNKSHVLRYKKVENFTNYLLGSSWENENWVSTHNESALQSHKYHLPHLWYQFDGSGKLKKDEPEKSEHQNLDFFRDLGPLQRKIAQNPEKDRSFFVGHSNVFKNLKEPQRSEELFMLSLGGLLPMKKIPQLLNKIDEIDTLNTLNSDNGQDQLDFRQEVLNIIDWE